jgi:hypothetical protein
LELAAQIIMVFLVPTIFHSVYLTQAPPNQVTDQARKDAEAFFMRLREGAISVDQCQQILETTQNQFLMFELARALVARILKEWPKFTQDDIKNICLYLLNFPVTHPK